MHLNPRAKGDSVWNARREPRLLPGLLLDDHRQRGYDITHCRHTRTCDTLRRLASVYAGMNRRSVVLTTRVMLPLSDIAQLVSMLNVWLVICEYLFILRESLYALYVSDALHSLSLILSGFELL
jgi:hypothetical protein